ncbi:hypothetical protein [Domibacillus antri]|uniref:hypothetical protein n=1 Tax=Domibacillus antri TaxID=1714264 RepID=UPI000B1151B0|nr:hypothetical protein [Domibacillus antri]
MSLLQHDAYSKMYQKDKMTLGFVLPLERMSTSLPKMQNQVEMAQEIERFGFAALWLRDVTIQNVKVDDNGQLYDLWIYLTYKRNDSRTWRRNTALLPYAPRYWQ